MKAYMFINAMRGQSLALTKAIKSIQGVTGADAITGDYDIVASVEARDLNDLRTTMAGGAGTDGSLNATPRMVLSDSQGPRADFVVARLDPRGSGEAKVHHPEN